MASWWYQDALVYSYLAGRDGVILGLDELPYNGAHITEEDGNDAANMEEDVKEDVKEDENDAANKKEDGDDIYAALQFADGQ